ncbi:hypothetical protein QYM36_006383, partial [Artemia franciscana]
IESEYNILLTLTDGKSGESSHITQSLLLLVEDINDNAPIFKPFPTSVEIPENGDFPKIIVTVEAIDRDDGAYGQVVYSLEEIDGDKNTFDIKNEDGKGVIRVLRSLDYEVKTLHQIVVTASDRAISGPINNSTVTIFVRVIDEEDKSPVFIGVPAVTRITENIPINTPVLTAKAIDGDRGVDNPIQYRILGDTSNLFRIDSSTGVVSTMTNLDRESAALRNGAVMITIEASEVSSRSSIPSTETIEVTIIILDVNDETPTFESPDYVFEVVENSPVGLVLTMISGISAHVSDHDLGSNGTFSLHLSGPGSDFFSITPTKAINDAVFVLKVANSTVLDFEKIKEFQFEIVAEELVPESPKSSSSSVTVFVRDANDNTPIFERPNDQVAFPEDLPGGAFVMSVNANDLDSGNYGKDGVRYTKLDGSMSDMFQLDFITGEIRTAQNASFDREAETDFFLTVEARDDLGEGKRGYATIHIFLLDFNDNAPEFSQKLYQFRVKENSHSFDAPAFLKATDSDEHGTPNSAVRFYILPGQYSQNFSIDEISGELTLREPLDFEKISVDQNDSCYRRVDLQVRANDLGEPQLSSVADVDIYVEDLNDNSPVFARDGYAVSIAEDIPEGSSIIQVKATDQDGCEPNNVVIYRLQNFLDKFTISPSTGVIFVAQGANLDPDQMEHDKLYDLKIIAVDGSIVQETRSSSGSVVVSIEDVNNKKPVIIHPEAIQISENTPLGSEIYRIKASDLDVNARLKYTIDTVASEIRNEDGLTVQIPGVSVQKFFELNNETGVLKLSKMLDREIFEVVRLAFVVEDLAAKGGRQISNDIMTIVVEDVNDNDPQFLRSEYITFVPENSITGTLVATVAARDIDKNRTIVYKISENVVDYLKVDSNTGDITVTGSIDREETSWLNFTITAIDSGVPRRSKTVPVFVQVYDENDRNPEFIDPPSKLSVLENASLGTIIATFNATDMDAGDYGQVTFLLDRSSSDGKFGIDSQSGELFVASHLNREEKHSYSLIIEAVDNQRYSGNVNSRHAFHQLTVSILDVNDEKPVLVLPQLCVLISELHTIGEPIAPISARDLDDNNLPNGKVSFDIISGNGDGLFDIEDVAHNAARIFTKKSLQGKFGNYSLRIRGRDMAEPFNEDEGMLSICVSDYNDNAPYFIYPSPNATIKIFENETLGFPVIKVEAKDDDSGMNAAIKYSLKKNPVGHWKAFSINETSGVLYLVSHLDAERQKYYDIRIEARDSGLPTSLMSELDLKIVVKSVFDDIPRFATDSVFYNFTENALPGREVYTLPNIVERDLDDSISTICYFIISGDELNHFRLDSVRHTLQVAKTLDREFIAHFELRILASDDCKVPSQINEASILTVKILVLDENDNAPRFVRRIFTGGIVTNAVYGSEILTLKATDADLKDELTYLLAGDIQQSFSEGLDAFERKSTKLVNAIAEELIRAEDILTPFMLNQTSGVLWLNFDPQPGMKGHFEFQVLVRDFGGLVDRASVFIYLLRGDQRVKFIVRQSPTVSRSKIDAFKDHLENITGLIVNIDEIRVHQSSLGAIDKTKSDLYLHFVYPENNSVIEAEDVLKMLDSNVEKLDGVFKEYDVLDTSPSEIYHLAAETALQESKNKEMAFLSMAAVFGLLLLLLLGVCLFQRNHLMRKLRAATAASYGSDPSRVNTLLTVPNTNRHRDLGSNPIWQSDTEQNDWFKDDDMFSRFSEIDAGDGVDENAIIDTMNTPSRYSHLVNSPSRGLEAVNRNIVNDGSSLDSRTETHISENAHGLSKGITEGISDYHKNIFNILDKINNPLLQGKPIETTEL